MGQGIKWTVTVPSLDKAQAAALAVEFWTSLGFEAHSSSYNRLVFRRNKYGTAGAVLDGVFREEGYWDDVPMELTILTLVLPSQVKYSLKFELGYGWHEKRDGDFKQCTEPWINDFIAFTNQWTSHARKAIEE